MRFYFDIIFSVFTLLFMENLKRIFNHIVIIPLLLLSSCGYVSDKPVEDANVYRADELQQTCKIDVSKLSEIFSTNQKEQILCLQQNFVQFTKYVRSKHPGAVTEAELGIFVKKFFEGQSDSIIKGLSLIFQLNMILLKDEADRISHNKISPLFDLLVKVNQEAVILTGILKSMDEDKNQSKFWTLRGQFNESTNRFATSAVAAIENSPGLAKQLNMRQFVIDMSKKIGDKEIDNETIDSFIFFKKLLVGGDEEVVTTEELKQIIAKLPKILGLVFDLYYVKGENFQNDTQEMRFYLVASRDLYSSIKFNQTDFELLTSDQLVTMAKKVIKDYDVASFKESIEKLKVKFIGGKKNSITLKDLDVLLNILHDFFEKVYFVHVTYDEPVNNYILSKKAAVPASEINFKPLAGYDLFRIKPRLDQLFASFKDTAVNFRYFRNDSGSAYYSTDILRNKTGFIEVNISKWLAWKLLNAYGHVDAKKNMQISMDEFSQFLQDSKPLLEEFNLWSPNFKTFARNAVLLADLFQHQSNGDQVINLNEATEYIGMILTAVDISGKFNNALVSLELCDGGLNPKEAIFDANCFNENFYDVFLNKLKFKEKFPRLNAYYTGGSQVETLEYLKGVQGFARDDNSPGVPVNRRDSTLLFGAMINIETTFIRFDTNADNILDFNELEAAFESTYKPSIIVLADLKGDRVKYAKAVFMYMVSKMEVPKIGTYIEQGSFALYAECIESPRCRNTTLFMDKIEAKRLNIGKLLYYMVNQPTPGVAKANP